MACAVASFAITGLRRDPPVIVAVLAADLDGAVRIDVPVFDAANVSWDPLDAVRTFAACVFTHEDFRSEFGVPSTDAVGLEGLRDLCLDIALVDLHLTSTDQCGGWRTGSRQMLRSASLCR